MTHIQTLAMRQRAIRAQTEPGDKTAPVMDDEPREVIARDDAPEPLSDGALNLSDMADLAKAIFEPNIEPDIGDNPVSAVASGGGEASNDLSVADQADQADLGLGPEEALALEDLAEALHLPEAEAEIPSTAEALHAVPRVAVAESREERLPMTDLPILPQEDLRKKELIDAVVARSGIRKRDAKPAVEAALAILGEALAQGRELNLRPMGKLKVTRMKKGSHGQIIHARVRQPDEDENLFPNPLAQAAE